jgi:SPX domain protein involved in polyphosphate accumulation
VSNAIPETQFSIYKIDAEKMIKTFFPDKKTATKSEMLGALLNSLEKILREKNNCENFSRIKFKGYDGVVFKTLHEPDWKSVLQQMLSKNESTKAKTLSSEFLLNANISYVLFRICKNSLYAMTGGYGRSLSQPSWNLVKRQQSPRSI